MEHQSSHRGRRTPEALADTIVAAATAPGRAAIAIVRVSGPQTEALARTLLGELPSPRVATLTTFRGADGVAIDTGLALYFPAPHSYTGEAVLELQAHGGAVVQELLVQRALELGARRAQPGEFTQRAYLNGRLDLAQAEAVADLIDAASGAAARAALRALEGEFSQLVQALTQRLDELRTFVEAAIDFGEEEIEILSDRELQARLAAASAELERLQARGRQGRLLTEGTTVVIAGPPNSGKSTLLNRLAGHEAAIVTPVPGTTRDVLRERIQIDGMPLHVLDTAGLRDSPDIVEAEGVRRARAAMAHADRVLFVLDLAADRELSGYMAERARLPSEVPVTLLLNKADLAPEAVTDALERARGRAAAVLPLSAMTGTGIDELKRHLIRITGFEPMAEGVVSARARHLEALGRASVHLAAAAQELGAHRASELIAEELKRARAALAEIVGGDDSEALLGRIFSSFCIGK